MNKTSDTQRLEVLYDSECPICDRFACSLRNTQHVSLIDGRQPSAHKKQSHELGLDINRGLIIYADGQYLFGADAFHYIANHTQAKGLFGFACRYLFKYRLAARFIYPLFVLTRRILLKILRIPLITTEHK